MDASIIVSTRNRKDILSKTLESLLNQDYKGGYEIRVVDDGSTDATFELIKEFEKKSVKIKALRREKSGGPAAGRNLGIKKSSGKFIVIMDDDCVAKPHWLRTIMKGFTNEKIGVCSSFDFWGGTSTAYRREVLEKIKLFDESYPTNFREDTDTIFKIQDLDYKIVVLSDAMFVHLHKQPSSLIEKIKYGLSRTWIHKVDPLLYKHHPERTRKFLDIKFGFLRNPVKDFETATGLWWKKELDFKFGSPQGVTLIENKSPIHTIAIILLGIVYVFLVKIARLYGSIKYGKLLV